MMTDRLATDSLAEQNADSKHFETHLDIDASENTVITHLKKNTTLSVQILKRALSNGSVWLESGHGIHRTRRAKKIPAAGNTLHLYYDEKIQSEKSESATLIADEGEYSVWNKPYGMYSQGSKWGDHCSIYRWAEQHLQPQRTAFLVHRLDRAANGLIILAHTKKMAATFSTLFKQRKIKKQYRAVIVGNIDTLTLPHTISDDIEGKAAITHIKEQQKNKDDSSTLLTEIETGRKHQIRKHLAGLNHPIRGDRLYGAEPFDTDLQLTACLLEFECPITKQLKSYSLKP